MKQAIGYLRQSTLKQQSLTAQRQMIMSLAKQYDIEHITFYSDKQSGRTDNRTGYQQISERIKEGQCDILCCYRLNRLHRNLKNALKLMKLCQKYHVHILSVHDGYFDMDKAFDRLKLNIFISLAELESDNIGEQVRNGLKEKTRQGKLITTHAPFGYRYHNGTFTINSDEAVTVKAVFNYYLQNSGYKKISQYLEEDNQLINRKPYQVRNIIMNPNYCGRVINKYGQSDNMFPSIVSKPVYEHAKEIRMQKQVIRIDSDNQLKQKIKCPCCQSTLTNMTIRKKDRALRYYVCPKNMNEAHFVCCFKGIRADKLENKVLNTCQRFFKTKQLYQKIHHTISKQLKRQQRIITQSSITKKQLIEQLAKGTIDVETFKKHTLSISLETKIVPTIKEHQLKSSLRKVIQQQITLNMIYPYIDEVHITKNKDLIGIYFKNEPLNIVNQNTQSSIA